MRQKLLFIVLSAVAKPGTVDQLARSLAPHRVLVHHDFSQAPDFRLGASNVLFVPDPKRTGWGSFGIVEAMCHSLRYALDNVEFDYVQLLSATCLPIKPMAEFEVHVDKNKEAHFDCIDLFEDRDAWKCLAYRAVLPKGTMRHRLMRRVTDAYFRGSSLRRDEAGIWLRSGGGNGPVARGAGWLIDRLRAPSVGYHYFDKSFRLHYGSPWFGARPRVARGVVDGFSRPGVREHFSRVHIADEFLIPTLLHRLGVSRGPMNHLVQRYEEAHVREFTDADFGLLRNSPKYFARKFPDDPLSPIRTRVLRELVRPEGRPLARSMGLPTT